MAFCNKVGNLLKQSISQNGSASMLNSIRCMATSTKLFVAGLDWGVDDHSLKDAFSSFGDVVEARVITDRDSGRSRGFGFVNFSSGESASSALSAMDGQELHGRSIAVKYATERPSGNRGFGGSNFSGGYGSREGGDGSF
ncbi:glycine-rich RNA-binding protein 2, mitochondrial-like [Rhodamnia argentea]|uniref:Glycine-rich RNA-binding protein 2, mitochondrial-like n=1 Tax=Rhodamnia argentea TaxID=178133 RepID=A0A8B8PGA4_9MYRT|nr:glycine-rich RNA-binding protein 2, mitochondrial-like [Rhodamnia argentea]XP_048130506.1 glycine-rich RNA-binding protein 2, mitochondrial-like [Rhodamnia argentea]